MKYRFRLQQILLLLVLSLFSCKSVAQKAENYNAIETSYEKENSEINDSVLKNREFGQLCLEVAKLSLEQQRGLLSMISIPDTVLTEETIAFLKKFHVCGVILFASNIVNERQLKQLISDLKRRVNNDLLIGIDQEGGSVVRIRWDRFSDISAMEIGKRQDKKYAYKVAYERAKMLRELGIDIIFGPVCDVAGSKKSYIYERSFGLSPEKVGEFVEITVKAQRDVGIISVLKHFPGHGSTETNSHIAFPEINIELNDLRKNDFLPFRRGIAAGAEMVLMGHIVNQSVEPDFPASLSRRYQEILYHDLHFRGIIITDDMAMTKNIDQGIGWGINLISGTFAQSAAMMRKITPDVIQCAKVLELIKNRKKARNKNEFY